MMALHAEMQFRRRRLAAHHAIGGSRGRGGEDKAERRAKKESA